MMALLGMALGWTRIVVIIGIISAVLSLFVEPGEAIVVGTFVTGVIEGMMR